MGPFSTACFSHESWVESNWFLGKLLESWVELNQFLGNLLESWVKSILSFRKMGWFDSNEVESCPGLAEWMDDRRMNGINVWDEIEVVNSGVGLSAKRRLAQTEGTKDEETDALMRPGECADEKKRPMNMVKYRVRQPNPEKVELALISTTHALESNRPNMALIGSNSSRALSADRA